MRDRPRARPRSPVSAELPSAATCAPAAAARMSDVLLDVASPLLAPLSLPEDLPAYGEALAFAASIWNLSRLPLAWHAHVLEELVRTLRRGGAAGAARKAVDAIYTRAMARYPHVRQIVVAVQVRYVGGGVVEATARSLPTTWTEGAADC